MNEIRRRFQRCLEVGLPVGRMCGQGALQFKKLLVAGYGLFDAAEVVTASFIGPCVVAASGFDGLSPGGKLTGLLPCVGNFITFQKG